VSRAIARAIAGPRWGRTALPRPRRAILLLVPGAVEEVVDVLVAESLRRHQALLGGSVQEALGADPARR